MKGTLEVIIGLGILVACLLMQCKVFKKAGYPFVWGFLMIIPLLNICLYLMFVFKEWPIQEELRKLKTEAK